MKKSLLLLLCLPMIGFGQQCKGDCENGKGAYTWVSGDKYVGEFKDQRFEGLGAYTWADGNKYVGEYKEGNFNGKGTFTWANGDKYTGGWKDGQFDGKGIYNDEGTLTKAEGEWKNNVIWNGIETRYGDKKEKEGLAVKFIYENGNIIDTVRNDRNYYNKEDVIGEERYCTIKLIDKRTKYDIILEINNTPIKWRFDTGAEGFSIGQNQWDKIKSEIDFEDLNIIRESKGVGGSSSGAVIRIKDEIKIGGYLVKNVIASISNEDYSLMGIGFFKKFSNVEWNMKAATLVLYK